MPLWPIAAVVAFAGLLVWWWRHRKFVALRWPPQHPNRFTIYCKAYLRRQGWRVFESKKQPGDFVIEAGSRKMLVFCRAHGFALNPILIGQLNRLHRTRPRIETLVICYDKPDHLAMVEAMGPRVIRYQALGEITPDVPEP